MPDKYGSYDKRACVEATSRRLEMAHMPLGHPDKERSRKAVGMEGSWLERRIGRGKGERGNKWTNAEEELATGSGDWPRRRERGRKERTAGSLDFEQRWLDCGGEMQGVLL